MPTVQQAPQEIVVVSSPQEDHSIVKIGIVAGVAGLIWFFFFRGSGSGTGKPESGTSKVKDVSGDLTFLLSAKSAQAIPGTTLTPDDKAFLQTIDDKPVDPLLSLAEIREALKARNLSTTSLRITGGTNVGQLESAKQFLRDNGIGFKIIESTIKADVK